MENQENNTVAEATQTKAPVVDETKVKLAEDNLESFRKEIKTKLYALKCDYDLLTVFRNFIENDAQWRGMEALGIEELTKTLSKAEISHGHIYLNNLEVEALHFFLMKSEGTGHDSAQTFLSMVRSVNEALKLTQADNRTLIKLENELAAAEQGITIGGEPEKEAE